MSMEKYKHLSEAIYTFAKAGILIILIYAILSGSGALIDTFRLLGNPIEVADEYEKLAVENLKIGNFEKSREFFQKSYDLYPSDDVQIVLRKYGKALGDTLVYAMADSILASYGKEPTLPFNILRVLPNVTDDRMFIMKFQEAMRDTE